MLFVGTTTCALCLRMRTLHHNLPAIDHMIQSLKNLCIVKTRSVRSKKNLSFTTPQKEIFRDREALAIRQKGIGSDNIFPLKDKQIAAVHRKQK